MPSEPIVIKRVPADQLSGTIEDFGPDFVVEVTPDGDGTFTVRGRKVGTPSAAPVAAPAAAATPAVAPTAAAASGTGFEPGPETAADYLETIPLPPKSSFNVGLASTGQHRLRELLGEPVLGGHYKASGDCMPPDNPTLTRRLVLRDVGPFRVTGVDVAVQALSEVLAQVKASRPRLFSLLGTHGMECARFTKVNGKIGPGVSTHAWGMAVDFKIGGQTDAQGDGRVLRGSLELARFFNAAGWYWGAGFPTEDGMHFEASASLVEQWRSAGRL